MAKWQVVPVVERCIYDSSLNFIMVEHKIVAPHYVEVESLGKDGTHQRYYAVKSVEDKVVKTCQLIPKGTKAKIKYFTVVRRDD